MFWRIPFGRLSYLIGFAIAGLALSLQWAVRPLTQGGLPFLFFLPAVALAAPWLGRGPALVVLGAGALSRMLLLGHLGAMPDGEELQRLCFYCSVGLLLVLYGARLRSVTQKAALAENRLTLALDDTQVGVFELNFKSGTALLSPSLCRMLDRPVVHDAIALEQWLGSLDPELVRESLQNMQANLARNQLHYEREQRLVLRNGEVRWLLTRVTLIGSAAGTLERAQGATVDITTRKNAKDALVKTQAELSEKLDDLQRLHAVSQQLVASGDDLDASLLTLLELLAHFHRTTLGFVSLHEGNKPVRVAAVLGSDRHGMECIARRCDAVWADDCTPADRNRSVFNDIQSNPLWAECREIALAAGLGSLHRIVLRSACGNVIGALWLGFAQERTSDERETRLSDICAQTAGAAIDRHRAWQAASENARLFSVTLESSPVPYIILFPVRDLQARIADFRCDYVNPAAAHALGSDASALLGQQIGVVKPGVWGYADLFSRLATVADDAMPVDFEIPAQGESARRSFHIIAGPLHGSVAVWFTDISERKCQEAKLLQADQRKDQFLAILAHELRNPLAPIRQAVHIASQATSTDTLKQWSMGVIERQVRHMSLLLDDLLDVSRISRGALTLKKTEVALAHLVELAVETALPWIESKQHTLTHMLPEVPVMIFVDALRISQVLANLLSNAAKYTDPGGSIVLEAKTDGAMLIVSIRDNGIGLNAEQCDSIFSMFSQCPHALDRAQGGLGIGLALSRGFVELHGGAITASSPGPGLGSEFVVRVPAVSQPALLAPLAPLAPLPGPPARRTVSQRVLIADDNVDAAESLAELLRLEGYEVAVAHDGVQALATFQSFSPDVALLDIGMPLMSGYLVASGIRQLPAGSRALLIAITGWGQASDQRRTSEAGFDHHFIKPVELPQLLGMLATWSAAKPTSVVRSPGIALTDECFIRALPPT